MWQMQAALARPVAHAPPSITGVNLVGQPRRAADRDAGWCASDRVQKASMDFSYESFEQQAIEAYERVLLDALIGDPTLFIRADEVGRSWKIVDPVLRFWAVDERPIPL
jgi:glucose-6-phosphate 1-dehydrogenase